MSFDLIPGGQEATLPPSLVDELDCTDEVVATIHDYPAWYGQLATGDHVWQYYVEPGHKNHGKKLVRAVQQCD